MKGFVRSALVFALLACQAPKAGDEAAAGARAFTRQYAKHKLHAFVAGSDCRVLLITIETVFDRNLVESIHYGASGYDAFGGVEQFAQDRGFRAVVYRDSNGNLWTYGATTRDEARSMPRCRGAFSGVRAATGVAAVQTKRALLIGIDDYTASTLPVVKQAQDRDWPDLRGAANDVQILTDMLVLRYGFERKNIVTLTNQQATRAAILRAIEQHLVQPAQKNDVVFYYFAGHGAQVPNAASDEPDHLDESIVPADSRRGADDIRDKELRPLFNGILERGARLTLLLDHCYSGGGFRGAHMRGIMPAPPIVDRRDYGPRPDERGALILAAAQDFEIARETRGDDGLMHGAFTWAWIRALRDATPGEAAQDTFLRAQARLRNERPDQSPAMLGSAIARLRPFLGTHPRKEQTLVAVESVQPDGNVILQGGWAHGLTAGTELRHGPARLHVTQILGLGRSVARMSSGSIAPGALLEITRRNNVWLSLTSNTPSPYHLAVHDEQTRQLVATVAGNRIYTIVLRASQPSPIARYYYVFVIDSRGRNHLVFPKTGSVENRFEGHADIPLGEPSAFRVVRPYGVDTYVLLSTEEPLPNPAILEWDDARALPLTPWSIERVTIESVAPGRRRASGARAALRSR